MQKHGFTVEHEEWELIRPFLTNLPPITDLPNVRSATFSNRNRAIKTFCTLYDNSFATYPWYQPYTAAEVAATLATSQDILFLRRDDIPIGFAWLHIEDGIGEIEPFGIVDAWQGHGYGRILLTAALHQLAQHGATSAQIGAWHNNNAPPFTSTKASASNTPTPSPTSAPSPSKNKTPPLLPPPPLSLSTLLPLLHQR
ncbi:MAG: GNAT family N-acetyltransferase [Chloroflexota bacterium]